MKRLANSRVHLNDRDGQLEKLPVGQGAIDFGAISNKLL